MSKSKHILVVEDNDSGRNAVTNTLKTRGYEEVEPSLRNMVQAAGQLREELAPARR